MMERKKSVGISEELLQQWHPEKNIGIDPLLLSSKSGTRPWWKCRKCLHEWEAPVYHRLNGTGCPKCQTEVRLLKKYKNDLIKRGNLAEKHPELISEWHPTKNNTLLPNQLLPSSGKKVWWKCQKGADHEWEASVSNRIKGKGCPVCAGRKTVLSNCLATTYPNIAKEWHPEKNNSLFPTDVTFGSHTKVWWLCEKGHEWFVSVANRRSSGKSECPMCLKLNMGQRRVKALIKKNGSLAETFPEIAKQWHPEKNGGKFPEDFTPGSTYRAWWRCAKGHEWDVPIGARRNHGCPKCSYQTSQLEMRIYCEINQIFSDALWGEKIGGAECDILLPNYKIALEVDGFPWHKNREEQDELKRKTLLHHQISLLRVRDSRLQKISNDDLYYKNRESHLKIIIRVLEHIKSKIALSKRHLAKISSYILGDKITNETEFTKMLSDVLTLPEQESILHLYPEIVKDWNHEKNGHLNPKFFTPGSEVLIHWKCNNNPLHEWKNKIKDRVRNKGCPFCKGKQASPENSFAATSPHLAKQWDYEKNKDLVPQKVTANSSRKVWWKCSCGMSWQATIYSRLRGNNQDCLNCYNKNSRGRSQIKKAIQKNGSFAEKAPNLAKEWHSKKNGSLLPSMLSCGSNINVWWKCPKGDDHEWQNSIVSRIQYPTCPFCCGKKVSIKNSLKFLYPKIAEEWHPTKNTLNSSEVTKSSGKKVWWLCSKNHEWQAQVNSRVQGRGCPYCGSKKASVSDNLSVCYPEIASEWHADKNKSLLPSDYRAKSNQKVWWRCSLNPSHEWETAITNRTSGTGCPYCQGKKPSSNYNLASVNPVLAKEWNSEKNLTLSPLDVTPNSGRRVWWKCLHGHEWISTINNRAKGQKCPFCRKLTIL